MNELSQQDREASSQAAAYGQAKVALHVVTESLRSGWGSSLRCPTS